MTTRRPAIRFAAALALGIGLAAPAVATPNPLAHYERLPRAERIAIEYDLIWIGAVDMVTNGVVGRESIAAIRDFESRIRNGHADGILDARERRRLARRAERARERAGYRVLLDRATGMRVGLPLAYAERRRDAPHGSLYEGGGVRIETFHLRQTLRETYEATLRKPGRQVTYRVLRGDWFVIAGREGGRSFYTRAHAGREGLRAFTITYDTGLRDRLEPVVVAMSNDLRPFAADARPERAPRAPRAPGGDLGGGFDGRDAPSVELPPVEEPAGPPRYTGPGSIERDYAAPVDGESCAGAITVSPGDTLSAIARRCGTSVAALRAANGGIAPRDLRAGQSLAIPTGRVAGQEAFEAPERAETPRAAEEPETYRPAIAVRPRALRAGGTAAIALTGFPSGAEVEVGFASGGPALTERVLTTGTGGAATVTLRLPPRIGAGDTVTVSAVTDDGAHRAEAGPFVVRPAEVQAGAPLSLSGMITGEGTACMAMRDEAGALWMLDSARAVAPGTAVRVEGFPAGPEAEARCGGRAVEVSRLSTR